MINKKGFTRTIILFSIAVYFVAIVFVYALIGNGLAQYGNPEAVKFLHNFKEAQSTENIGTTYVECGQFGILSGNACFEATSALLNGDVLGNDDPYQSNSNPYQTQKGTIGVWKSMLISINVFPWWLQTILFAPLIAMFTYLLLTAFIPTINAGQ